MGAGGHGKVVADTASKMKRWQKIAFLDDRYPVLSRCSAWEVVGTFNQVADFQKEFSSVIVAVGDNAARLKIFVALKELGFDLPCLIDPTANVSTLASIGLGTVVFANSVVNADSIIGEACIINTAAIVEHDCKIASGVHISPNASLAGGVQIGQKSWVGLGANVIGGVSIGENVIVGAGAVVLKDISGNLKVVGVPARIL